MNLQKPMSSFAHTKPNLLQCKCACGGHNHASGECEQCRTKRLDLAQPIVQDVLQSPGHSLDHATHTSMESGFGHDFSHVKVHSDAQAATSARAVNALAYTVGNNLVFGLGQYSPATTRGQKLLAHELTHVIQQESIGGSLQTAGINIMGNDRYEREAEAAANGIVAGQQIHIQAGGNVQGIQRWPWPGGAKTQENDCAGYEQDPQSLSIETAKHFLDDVQPGIGSRLVKTTECKANENDPERFECVVTFGDGRVIQVSIETKLHNVEGQRPTANGREWCVYHFTCGPNGVLLFQKKGCSADFKAKPSAPIGPDLVGARPGTSAEGKSKTV